LIQTKILSEQISISWMNPHEGKPNSHQENREDE
jgi:hypothetical protein